MEKLPRRNPERNSKVESRNSEHTFQIKREAWVKRILKDRELNPHFKVVAVALSMYLNRKTKTAWPEVRTLAEMCGISKTYAHQAVRALQRRGYLSIEARRFSGKLHNIYQPALPEQKETASVAQDDFQRVSATGENALRTLAQTLLQKGADPSRRMQVFRGGELVCRTTVGAEAGMEL